jgi:hypothetical protein
MRLISADIFRISSVWMSAKEKKARRQTGTPRKKKNSRPGKEPELADAAEQ